ncbi:MAG: DUF63 family protein [Candidatus Thermoplasmatota archaeon]
MGFKEYIKKHLLMISFILIVLSALVVLGGCFLAPQIFYDQWIWKYYWGPVVSDAAGYPVTYHGVTAYEGYTLISEITYGIILIVALYGIYKLLRKLDIRIDWRFCLALMPYILFGPVTRVLEDAEYFTEPFVFWFISPLIYFQIAGYALSFVCIGWYLQKNADNYHHIRSITDVIFIVLFVNIFYSVLWTLGCTYGKVILHPGLFLFLSLSAFVPLIYHVYKKRKITVNTMVFSGGMLFFLPSLYLVGLWIIGENWSHTAGVRFDVFILIFVLVASVTSIVYLVSVLYKQKSWSAPYRQPLNLAMIIGHLIDGWTSYISIYDPLGMGLLAYEEKHPASNFLLEIWPPLFPIVKFCLIVVVIYLFDIAYKEELRNHQHLVHLLKIGILILGFSPGMRDLLRVTMGV